MKIAITGDRSWPGTRYNEILKPLQSLAEDTVVILGDATGVDSLARLACESLGLEHVVCCANWERYGRAAGPHRNSAMLDREPDEVWWWHPDLPSSKGTKNMLGQAEKRGIPTINQTEPR